MGARMRVTCVCVCPQGHVRVSHLQSVRVTITVQNDAFTVVQNGVRHKLTVLTGMGR